MWLSPIEPFGWKDNSAPDLEASQLEAWNSFVGKYADSKGTGERQTVFTPDPGAPQLFELKSGSSATPDTTYAPLLRISRTLSVPESAFTGGGEGGLAAIMGVTKAVASSQGQAIGLYGGALTEASNTGEHAGSDAVAVYGSARALAGSKRCGIGAFFAGRRQDTGGETTGVEIVSNNQATDGGGGHLTTGASKTKGIWIHAPGKSGSATGIQFGRTATDFAFEVGIGFNEGSTSAASIYDASQSLRAIRIEGSHAKAAICVATGAGSTVLGALEPTEACTLQVIGTQTLLTAKENKLGFFTAAPVVKPTVNKAANAETLNTALKELGLIGGT